MLKCINFLFLHKNICCGYSLEAIQGLCNKEMCKLSDVKSVLKQHKLSSAFHIDGFSSTF